MGCRVQGVGRRVSAARCGGVRRGEHRPAQRLHPSPYNEHPTPYILHPTPYTLHPTPYYTLHPTPCTLHPAPYTLHPTHNTPHTTPYTLHPQPSTLHSTPYTLQGVRMTVQRSARRATAPAWHFAICGGGRVQRFGCEHSCVSSSKLQLGAPSKHFSCLAAQFSCSK